VAIWYGSSGSPVPPLYFALAGRVRRHIVKVTSAVLTVSNPPMPNQSNIISETADKRRQTLIAPGGGHHPPCPTSALLALSASLRDTPSLFLPLAKPPRAPRECSHRSIPAPFLLGALCEPCERPNSPLSASIGVHLRFQAVP